MAAVTHRVTTADTGITPNVSGAFNPAVGDLFVVFCNASGTTDAAPTLVWSVGGITMLLVDTVEQGGNRLYVFIADALTAATTSGSFTLNTPNDAATGTVITCYSVSGMTKTGLAAIRGNAKIENEVPGPTGGFLPAAALTENPTFNVVINNTNPAGLTTPSGWTENAAADTGYASPTTGMTSAYRDSGFTGTTILWATESLTNWASATVELDTSVGGGQPTMKRWGGVGNVGGRKPGTGGGFWGRAK